YYCISSFFFCFFFFSSRRRHTRSDRDWSSDVCSSDLKSSRSDAGNGKTAERAYSSIVVDGPERAASRAMLHAVGFSADDFRKSRSEEHTSELQSRSDLVCRLLLEKKKKKKT